MDGLVYALVGVLLEVVERVLGDISHRSRIRRIYTEHGQKASKDSSSGSARTKRTPLLAPAGPSSRYVTRTCADASIQISYLPPNLGAAVCCSAPLATVSLITMAPFVNSNATESSSTSVVRRLGYGGRHGWSLGEALRLSTHCRARTRIRALRLEH